MRKTSLVQVEPDQDSDLADLLPAHDNEPNRALAIVLLASGQTHQFVRAQCGFESMREVQAFARDEDIRQAVREQRAQRVERIGSLALVSLEKVLTRNNPDMRAQCLAIRTGLDVSGTLAREAALPVKSVSDLSVSELNELIASTKAELSARLAEYRPDGTDK
jgi:hypothetical protein